MSTQTMDADTVTLEWLEVNASDNTPCRVEVRYGPKRGQLCTRPACALLLLVCSEHGSLRLGICRAHKLLLLAMGIRARVFHLGCPRKTTWKHM